MARIRTIKPEFPQSESMGNVSRDARLCFLMLWTISDDDGRLRGNSRMLASLLFPYDNDAPGLIDKWLTELEEQQCICRYEVAGHSYIQIINWLEHQKIDRPSPSKIPPLDEASRNVSGAREASSQDLDLGSRTKDQDIGASAPVAAPGADDLASAVEGYNAVAKRCGLPTVAKLTDDRRTRLRVRLREHGMEAWRAALIKLAANRWMHGENDRGWRADFDFLLQPKSFNRLLEGGYDHDEQRASGTVAGDVPERRRPQSPPPLEAVADGG